MLRRLLLDGPATDGRRTALRLRGAYVTGSLDLSGSEVAVAIEVERCHFADELWLEDVQAPTVQLTACTVPRVEAARLRTRDEFSLARCEITGGVRLTNASVGGDLVLDGATIGRSPRGYAVVANGLEVGQDLRASSLSVQGQLSFRDARIGGGFELRSVDLRRPHQRLVLDMSRVAVEGGFYLTGELRGTPAAGTSNAGQVQVRGGVRLDDGVFGRAVVIAGTRLHLADGQELSMRRMRTPELRLTPIWEDTSSGVVLTDAKVGKLVDAPQSWPSDRLTDLSGFTYQQLAPVESFSLAQRLAWVAEATPVYDPGPYDQLAAALRADGENSAAEEVLLGRMRHRRAGLSSPLVRAWETVQDAAFGYGYRPARAVFWLLALWLLGSIWFLTHRPAPMTPGQGPAWNAAAYTLDLLLPFLDLGQQNQWHTTGASEWVAISLVVLGWILTVAVTAGAAAVIMRRT
ncbi:oxidoreductase [Streptomyces sp. NPDC016566]|uniref:oxidoreductase n=1 Tax=Streptomyces sp. NPDC016566 TaxID=3364967 RepID=UPI0036F9D16C